MSEAKRIKTALVSVYHKEGLDEIITKLHEEGVEFLSTDSENQDKESRAHQDIYGISNCGMENEQVYCGLDELEQAKGYLYRHVL